MPKLKCYFFAFLLILFGKIALSQDKSPVFISKSYFLDNNIKKPLYRNNDPIIALVAQPAKADYSFILGGQKLSFGTKKLPLGLWKGYSYLNLSPADFAPAKNPQHLRFAEWVASQYLLKDTGIIVTKELVLDINYPQSRYKIASFASLNINSDTERRGLELQLRQLMEDSTNASYLLASARSQQREYEAEADKSLAEFALAVKDKSKQADKWTELAKTNQQISRELLAFQQNQDQKAAYKIGDLTTTREKLFNGLKMDEPELLPIYEQSQLAYVQAATNGLNIKQLEQKILSLGEELRLLRLRLK